MSRASANVSGAAARGSGTSAAAPMSVVGLLSSAGAVFTGWCCVLPPAFAALGVSGAGLGALDRFVVYRPYFLAAALLSLTAGWFSFALRRRAAGCEVGDRCARAAPRRWTAGVLALSTVLLIVAWASAWL